MKPEATRRLIASGETLAVEFKSERRRSFSDRDLVETVACMANHDDGETGWVLLGVEDDGTVTGARPRHEAGRTDPLRVQALIGNRTRPAITVRVSEVELDGKPVLVVAVPRSNAPVGTADGRYLRRAWGGDGKPACVPFHYHEMASRQADLGALDYSALALPDADVDALDPLEFERFRRSIRENRGDDALLQLSDMEIAKALGAVESTNGTVSVRVLGLLLFGRMEALTTLLPTHEVAFQVLAGTSVRANEFFRLPLLRVYEELEMRFRARTNEEEMLVGMARVGVPDYAPAAFKEGVANALAHRDYTRLGAVHVQWREGEIRIDSPGGLPPGVRLDNLLVTPPRPRNPLLADALKRAGLVERTARGIDTIVGEQIRNGHPRPHFDLSTEAGVSLVLKGGSPDMAFVRLLIDAERRGPTLGVDELIVLAHCWRQGSIQVDGAARNIQRTPQEALETLESLAAIGVVESSGEGDDRTWAIAGTASR